MTTFVMTVVVLGFLVLVHELGHFVVARAVDVRVDEFSIGFGPQLTSIKNGETEYSIRIIPLGGYVRMAGMQPEPDEDEEPTQGRGLREKSISQRFGVFLGGVVMNFLTAILLFSLVFGVIGIDTGTLVVDTVKPGLPAAEADLREGDRVVSVNGQEVSEWPELVRIIQTHPGEALDFVVIRDGREVNLSITPVAQGEQGQGFIGMAPVFKKVRLGMGEAVVRGVELTGAIIGNFVNALSQLFRGQEGPEFIGVVGIGAQIGEATRLGLANLLFFSAILSTSLGLINLLPIPSLDGSHLVFLAVEKLRGRPVDPDKENMIHFVGFALLILLAIFITYRDILRLSG